jgi:molecular chaperone GrpE
MDRVSRHGEGGVVKDNSQSGSDDRTNSEFAEPEEQVLLPAEELIPGEEEEIRESEVVVLQKELQLLEGQLQDMRDRYVRAVADLDNMRKRTRREVKEAQQRAASSVLLDVLGIVDNFERALGATNEAKHGNAKALHDGIVLIYRQLVDTLGRRGVKPIAAVGKRFDPAVHEAVAQVPAGPEQEEGMVALEIQKGYMHGDQVLRPTKVGVTVHTAQAAEK